MKVAKPAMVSVVTGTGEKINRSTIVNILPTKRYTARVKWLIAAALYHGLCTKNEIQKWDSTFSPKELDLLVDIYRKDPKAGHEAFLQKTKKHISVK